MREQNDQMKCPKCGRFELKEVGAGIQCRICGYQLSPGQSDRFRLYKLLREEAKKSK